MNEKPDGNYSSAYGYVGSWLLDNNIEHPPGVSNEAIVSEVAQAIVQRKIVALRIESQPPYGFMFRVDDRGLVEKVWIKKGRLDSDGKPDLSRYKPVTALSDEQTLSYIDWDKLVQYGYTSKEMETILRLRVHTVLPVVESQVPSHLITHTSDGPTLSIMKFEPETVDEKIVEAVSRIDKKAIIGGTSANPTGKTAYTNSVDIEREMGGKGGLVDLFLFSEHQSHAVDGNFHPMITVGHDRTVKFLRKGIGFTTICEEIRNMEIHITES